MTTPTPVTPAEVEALSRWEGCRRDAGRVCEIIDAALAAGVAALKSGGGACNGGCDA